MAKINIYFEDLREDTKEEIIQMLREELKPEIKDTIESTLPEGLNATPERQQQIENEVIDYHLNTHNLAVEYSI